MGSRPASIAVPCGASDRVSNPDILGGLADWV